MLNVHSWVPTETGSASFSPQPSNNFQGFGKFQDILLPVIACGEASETNKQISAVGSTLNPKLSTSNNYYFRMSSDKSPPPSPPLATPSLSSQVWSSITSLVLGGHRVNTTRDKTSLDMQDITYLMDMDGEGLCFHQINKDDKAFKKQ